MPAVARGRTRARRRSLGAAMVEATVVVPVLVVCFGAMMFAGGARFIKLGQQQKAREGALTYAMSGCQHGGLLEQSPREAPSLRDRSADVDPIEAANTGHSGTNALVRDAVEETVERIDGDFGAANGAPTPKAWSWTGGSAVEITARSYYFCNENDEGSWDAFSFAEEHVRAFLR